MIKSDIKIILIGATGFTGKIIVEELNKKSIRFSIGGRTLDNLNQIKEIFTCISSVEIFDVNGNFDLLNKYDLIINCIGPFNLWGKPVLDYCINNGKIYIDITGEQEFVKNSFENNSKAIVANATIIHSISFESCIADILIAENWIESEEYENISTFYYFNKSKPSKGTKLTMQLSSHFNNFSLEESELIKKESLDLKKAVFFKDLPNHTNACFMPYPEVVFIKHRKNVKNGASFLLLNEVEFRYLRYSRVNKIPIDEIILKHNRSTTAELSLEERKKLEFILYVKLITTVGKTITIGIRGNDMYGLTAQLVCNLTKKIIEGKPLPKGVLMPSEAFDSDWDWDNLGIEKLA